MLVVGGLVAILVWLTRHVPLRVDNSGPDPVQVWLDGQPEREVAPRTLVKFWIPKGGRILGHSTVGAAAPEESTFVEVKKPLLYNPGKTGCYFTDRLRYRVGAKPTDPPDWKDVEVFPRREIYQPRDKVNYWFKEAPTEIRLKNGTTAETRRVFDYNEACMELLDKGCANAPVDSMVDCMSLAKSEDAMQRCIDRGYSECGL